MEKANNTRHVSGKTDSGNYVDETLKWGTIEKILQSFPGPQTELVDGVVWGRYDTLFTPAYWKIQYHLSDFSVTSSHKLGDNILEEIVACLLGGYGLPSEMGLKAFFRLKDRCLTKKGTSYNLLHESLKEAFVLENGRRVHYRFYNQKSKFIAELLNRNDLEEIPFQDDLALRNWLLAVKGIGPKTASWITRNWLSSELVAILDVHLLRAGVIAGIFEKDVDVTRSYFDLEQKFLNFCKALEVKPSNMDALIWRRMKNSGRIAINFLNH